MHHIFEQLTVRDIAFINVCNGANDLEGHPEGHSRSILENVGNFNVTTIMKMTVRLHYQ